MTGHTEGPWTARQPIDQERFAIFYGEPGRIRQLDDLKGGFKEEDAHLIAAAPDLLEALKSLSHWAHWANEKLDFGSEPLFPEWAKAKTAIAKSEGRP